MTRYQAACFPRAGETMNATQRKEAKASFLLSLRTDPNVSLACDVAEISRETAYAWRKSDQAFALSWDNALERCRDTARSSIYQRGIYGWDEPALSQGQLVYTTEPVLDDAGKQTFEKGKPVYRRGEVVMVHKWSDSLAAAYAKANLPEYKDKPQVNINAQLADLAEQAKQALLADLAAQIANEDQEPTL